MILCFIQLLALYLAFTDPPTVVVRELCNSLSMPLLGVIDFVYMCILLSPPLSPCCT